MYVVYFLCSKLPRIPGTTQKRENAESETVQPFIEWTNIQLSTITQFKHKSHGHNCVCKEDWKYSLEIQSQKEKIDSSTIVNHSLPTTNQIPICTSLSFAKEETQKLIPQTAKSHSDAQISPTTSSCKSQMSIPSTHVIEPPYVTEGCLTRTECDPR